MKEILDKIREVVDSLPDGEYRVMAHELTFDGEGWSSNDRWSIYKGDKEGIMDAIEGRFPVFIINYTDYDEEGEEGPDVEIDEDDENLRIELDCMAFIDLEVIK